MAKSTEKSPEKKTHDFVFSSDADLNAQIAAHQARHEAEHGQRLAMDARRPLGPGKVRITFRVVDKRR
jgi:hypothetical protein